MLRLQRDIDALMHSRKPLAIAGRKSSVLSAFYFLRELPPDAPPMLFLLHAPKRQTRPAHERNKLKRWMREAIRQSDEMKEAHRILAQENRQALILIRATMPPSADCSWNQIQDDVRIISALLIKKISA